MAVQRNNQRAATVRFGTAMRKHADKQLTGYRRDIVLAI
jgi:hypothetical protein